MMKKNKSPEERAEEILRRAARKRNRNSAGKSHLTGLAIGIVGLFVGLLLSTIFIRQSIASTNGPRPAVLVEEGQQEPGGEDVQGRKVLQVQGQLPDTESLEEEYMGTMEVAAYCGGRRTYSGDIPEAGRTIAADLSKFEIGDQLRINDTIYYVEDFVPNDSEEDLRVYFSSYEEAIAFGRQELNVYRIEKEEEEKEGLLGEFEVTGYCSCSKCCGYKATKLTKMETVPKSSYTVAVDPDVIPLGSKIEIDGTVYLAEDTGKRIKGNIVDIYFDTHEEALIYGRKTKKVYLVQ